MNTFYPYVLVVLKDQYLKYKYLQMVRKICFETNCDGFVLMTLEKVLLLRNKIPLNCMRKYVLKYYFGKKKMVATIVILRKVTI